jgi:ribosomal protein S15P/S13E
MTSYTGDTYTVAYRKEQIEQDIAEFDKALRFPGFQQTLHSLAADMGHLASAFADTGNKGMRDRMDYFHKEISYLINRIKRMEAHIFDKHFKDKSEASNKMLTTLLDSATTIIPIREKEY